MSPADNDLLQLTIFLLLAKISSSCSFIAIGLLVLYLLLSLKIIFFYALDFRPILLS
jgi:hypothetical protein